MYYMFVHCMLSCTIKRQYTIIKQALRNKIIQIADSKNQVNCERVDFTWELYFLSPPIPLTSIVTLSLEAL